MVNIDDSISLAIKQVGKWLQTLSNYYTGFYKDPLMFMDLVTGSKYNNSLFAINKPGAW